MIRVIYGVVMTVVIFVILPFIYGQLWKDVIRNGGVVFTFLSGFFTILAVFGLLGPGMIVKRVPLHTQVQLDTAALIILAVTIIAINRKQVFQMKQFIKQKERLYARIRKITKYELVYIVVFTLLMFLSVYYSAFFDIGAWRSDEGVYVVLSSSAIYDDYFFATDFVSGVHSGYINAKYAVCGIYVFYAYVAVVTGFGVSVIEYSVCSVLYLLMSYGAFYLVSKYLFQSQKECTYRFVFLSLLSIIYLFGLHSHIR